MGTIYYPDYYLTVVHGTQVYNLSKVVTTFQKSHAEQDLAQKVTFTLPNIEIDGKKIKSLIGLGDAVYCYHDIGEGKTENFRGTIWTVKTQEDKDIKEIGFIAYDRLIYLQESKDSFYFSKGKATKTILSSIFSKWGVPFKWGYVSIKHEKQAIHTQCIADTIIDLLEEVRLEKGSRYIVLCNKGTVYVNTVGKNTKIYNVRKKENLSKISVEESKSGMVTKVVIRGPQNKSGKTPVKATVKGNVSKYGTLQDEISKDKDTSLSKAKKEANQILKEKGKPQLTREIEEAVDNPAINKGDTVYIYSDNLTGNYIVKSIEHDFLSRTMSIEVY